MTFLDLYDIQKEAGARITKLGEVKIENTSLDGRKGGILTLDQIEGLPQSRVIIPVGILEKESAIKRNSYLRNSLEKAERLRNHFRRDQTAVSSWQTRNEEEGMYGGAIITTPRGGIISFSGLPEEYDEALCLSLSYHLGIGNDNRSKRIMEASENQVIKTVLEKERSFSI